MVRLPRHENTHLAGADPPPHPCTSSDDAITLWPKWRGASRSELETHRAAAAVWSGGGGGVRESRPLPPGLIYRPALGCVTAQICCRGQGLIVPHWGLFLIERSQIWDPTRPNAGTILFPAARVNEACRLLPQKSLIIRKEGAAT